MRLKLPILIVAAVVLCTAPAFAQQSVVAKHRAKFPTPMSSAQINMMLRAVAAEVGGGILRKTSGNNCLGYSCDIICFADGRQFDVLRDQEGKAEPVWNRVGDQPNPSLCELQSSPAPDPDPDPDPEPPPSNPAELAAILAEIKAINAKLDLMLAQKAAENAALAAAIQELQKQVAAGVKIRF